MINDSRIGAHGLLLLGDNLRILRMGEAVFMCVCVCTRVCQ